VFLLIYLSGKSLPERSRGSEPKGQETAPAVGGVQLDLSQQAREVLQKFCHRCHGQNGTKEGGIDYILDLEKLVSRRKIIPSNPEKSTILRRIQKGSMPPEDETPRPGPTEIAILEQWIRNGVRQPTATRSFRTEKDVLTAIRDDLRRLPDADRSTRRYFTFTHLQNQTKTSAPGLATYQIALAKLVNSLSWRRDISIPEALDAEGTVYRVNLRDLDWDRRDLWREVLKAYPYGLRQEQNAIKELREAAEEVAALSGSPLPYVRADWFIATASRPPLYHTMLALPDNAGQLERILGVDAGKNIVNNQAKRAGFVKSGVSVHPRLIERHPIADGAYWKSYDFKTSDGPGNFFLFPLGPRFAGNPFEVHAFRHDGGEIIFNLPNGLQGYFLVDAEGRRINVGPIQVVRDKAEIAGGPEIVTGLSCMGCHRDGLISEGITDEVRKGHGLRGVARIKVEQLHPTSDEMGELFRQDRERFLRALGKAIGKVMPAGAVLEDAQKEPIAAVATRYLRNDLTLLDVASELGIENPEELRKGIEKSRALRETLGLRLLVEGGAIKRETWESFKGSFSTFQEVTRELDLGQPFRQR
jgi:serine/threonine-protein kinase